MPKHTPQHMRQMAEKSRASRRADLIAQLLQISPRLSEAQHARLKALLDERLLSEGGPR